MELAAPITQMVAAPGAHSQFRPGRQLASHLAAPVPLRAPIGLRRGSATALVTRLGVATAIASTLAGGRRRLLAAMARAPKTAAAVAGRRPRPSLARLRHGPRGGIAGGRTAMRQSMGWANEQATAEEEAPIGIDEQLFERFFAYIEGDSIHMQRGGLRSLLECTESFCLAKRWLPDSFVDSIYTKYATKDGIGFLEFVQIASDGLLLQGHLEEYDNAFVAMDKDGDGFVTREELNHLFAGLGRILAPAELDRILEDAELGHDGIDFADFLGLARTHLDLGDVLKYISTTQSLLSQLPSPPLAPDASLGTVTTVHSKTELDAIVESGADAVVQLAFTWCRACRDFWPRYKLFAKVYSSTRFLKIVGNENESTKHYAHSLKVTSSPMFAAYSKGKLVSTWTGANDARFISTMEEFVRIAGEKSVGHLNPQYVSSRGHVPIAF
mmetsp:Transcript_116812/g.238971  ORF Transcript_116812/g.238971 Transcript_116812/m.238971 type:complete len:441 (-) Transcript_116812:309-1631(-)